MLLDKLGHFEVENFEAEFADQNWYKGKQQKEIDAMEKARKRGKMSESHCRSELISVVTKDQRKIFDQIKKFVEDHRTKPSASDKLSFVNSYPARDRRFLQELADDLRLRLTWDETDDYGQSLAVLRFDMEGVSEDGQSAEGSEDEAWESDEDEGDLAIQRVLGKYEKAKVVENVVEDFEESYEEKLKAKMDEWKRGYYKVS